MAPNLICMQAVLYAVGISFRSVWSIRLFICNMLSILNLILSLCCRRSVYWDNNLAKDWDNIEPTKSGIYFYFI